MTSKGYTAHLIDKSGKTVGTLQVHDRMPRIIMPGRYASESLYRHAPVAPDDPSDSWEEYELISAEGHQLYYRLRVPIQHPDYIPFHSKTDREQEIERWEALSPEEKKRERVEVVSKLLKRLALKQDELDDETRTKLDHLCLSFLGEDAEEVQKGPSEKVQ